MSTNPTWRSEGEFSHPETIQSSPRGWTWKFDCKRPYMLANNGAAFLDLEKYISRRPCSIMFLCCLRGEMWYDPLRGQRINSRDDPVSQLQDSWALLWIIISITITTIKRVYDILLPGQSHDGRTSLWTLCCWWRGGLEAVTSRLDIIVVVITMMTTGIDNDDNNNVW